MQLKAFIKNTAAEKHISAQLVMQNYMLERLLERISLSPYKNTFILKGGFLISAIVGLDTWQQWIWTRRSRASPWRMKQSAKSLQRFALSRLPTTCSLRSSVSLTFGKPTITPASGLRWKQTIRRSAYLWRWMSPRATQKRGSGMILTDYPEIMKEIRESDTLRRLWEKYSREYEYAKDIAFDDTCNTIQTVMDAIMV